ncbi:MAG: hypothetical protein ACJ8DC_20475, partial [Gemmatimonadales bacterium]
MLTRSLGRGAALAFLLLSAAARAWGQAASVAAPRSAPLTNLRYEIAYDSAAAQHRSIAVTMNFDVAGPGLVLLSLPAWTPGAYELS